MRHQFSAMDRRRSELVNSIINEWEKASLNYRIGRIAEASGRDDSHLALFMYGGKMLLQIIPPFRPVFWRLIYLPISHSTNGLLQRKNDGKIHDDGWEIYWKFCFFASTSIESRALLSKRFPRKRFDGTTSEKRTNRARESFPGKVVHAQFQIWSRALHWIMKLQLLSRSYFEILSYRTSHFFQSNLSRFLSLPLWACHERLPQSTSSHSAFPLNSIECVSLSPLTRARAF